MYIYIYSVHIAYTHMRHSLMSYICIYICVCIYIYIYVCVCVCVQMGQSPMSMAVPHTH